MPVSVPSARAGQRLGEVLLDELKERLLAGSYPVGSRISIEEVKAEFGVSKQPVMDAMRRLEATGIVEIVPQSGCRVAHYSPPEIRDFFNLFGRFEGEIAAAAATRRSDAQLVELGDAWQRIADLEELDDPEERSRQYRFLNRDYHLVIHRMSHSRVMANLSERMWDLSDFFVTTIGGVQQLSNSIPDRNHDHDVIRTAIRSQNPDVARAAMETHIVGTVAAFSATLDTTG
ncbi:MAG TPA: GntR family transcriptional regulator [Mycobacterium sp.]